MMNTKIFVDALATQKHPAFAPGDTVAVHIKIKEGEKERIQIFEGIVMRKKGGGNTANFTVRKISFGVGVERIFPLQCSNIEKIEVVKRGKVRRAKLFYIRELQGKALRIEDKVNFISEDTEEQDGSSSKSKTKVTPKKGDTQEAVSA